MDHYNCGIAGEHKNQISIKSPSWWKSSKDFFSVDPCIASEIIYLIVRGVRTLNSCCGHNKIYPSVCVDFCSVNTMQSLGYVNAPEFPDRPEIFILKGDK